MIDSSAELMQALQRDSGHQHAALYVTLNGQKFRIHRVYATPGTYPATTTIELLPAPLPQKIELLSIGQHVEVWEEDAGGRPRVYCTGVLTGETEDAAIVRPDPQYQQQYQTNELRVDKTTVFAFGTVRTRPPADEQEASQYTRCESHGLYFALNTHPTDCQDHF